MIAVETVAPGLLALTVTGKIGKPDIDAAIAAIEKAYGETERISIVADLSGFEGMSAEAFVGDLRYGLSHLNDLKRYDRVAIITDRDWIEALVWVEGKLVPGATVRCFEPDERDDARRFAAGEDVPERKRPSFIRRIPADRPDALAFAMGGKLTGEQVKAFTTILTEAYDNFAMIDLLIRIDSYEGFEFSSLFDRDTWSMKGASFSKIRRYALVGAPSFIRNSFGLFATFLPFETKMFDAEDEDEAWAWIGARKAKPEA